MMMIIKRTDDQRRKNVEQIKKCKTKSTQYKKEIELGCRYSALLELPYCDAVRRHVIDPMLASLCSCLPIIV